MEFYSKLLHVINFSLNYVFGKTKFREGDLKVKDMQVLHKIHKTIKNVTEYMEGFKFNFAVGELMALTNTLHEYRKDAKREIMEEGLRNLIKLMSPFSPHVAEECWEMMGGKGFVSVEKWPKADKKKIDERFELMERLVETTREDIIEILKMLKKKPERIDIFVSPLWKYYVYEDIIKGTDMKNVIRNVMKRPDAKKYGKDVARFVEKLSKSFGLSKKILTQEEELKTLEEAIPLLEKEFRCKVTVTPQEKASSPRAMKAEPGKPGIEIV